MEIVIGDTAWKVSKYGVFSGPEKISYVDTFHAVWQCF